MILRRLTTKINLIHGRYNIYQYFTLNCNHRDRKRVSDQSSSPPDPQSPSQSSQQELQHSPQSSQHDPQPSPQELQHSQRALQQHSQQSQLVKICQKSKQSLKRMNAFY